MSASSTVEICNLALTAVGAETITSLDDEETRARLVSLHYPRCRDTLLSLEDWAFARARRGPLSPLEESPEFGYSYQFTLPTGCYVMRWVSDAADADYQIDHEVEGNVVLANHATIYTKFTQRIEDTTKFSQVFTAALVAYLASELAIPISESRLLHEQLKALYTGMLTDAHAVDGLQGTNKRMRAKRLTAARRSGSRSGFSREFNP